MAMECYCIGQEAVGSSIIGHFLHYQIVTVLKVVTCLVPEISVNCTSFAIGAS